MRKSIARRFKQSKADLHRFEFKLAIKIEKINNITQPVKIVFNEL